MGVILSLAYNSPDGWWLIYRVYSTGAFVGLKLAIFDHFCDHLVTYKGIPPYILVYFLSRFSLISGGSKIDVKKAEIRQ